MPANITQDILYNFICNVGAFAEGMDRAIHGIEDLDKSMVKVEKNTSFLNRTLSTFIANIGVKLVEGLKNAIGQIKTTIQGVLGQFIDLAKSSTMQAARIEVQWRTLALTAGNFVFCFGGGIALIIIGRRLAHSETPHT